MKLQQLRYFQSACINSSITKASEELHVSQPSISMAIRDLENEFGVALTARRYRGFYLTDAGRILLEEANSLIKHADNVTEVMAELGNSNRKIRLGIPPMIGSYLLPGILKSFPEVCPGAKLITTENGTDILRHDLREDVFDFVIVPLNKETVPSEFDSVLVMHEECVFCVSKKNRLATRRTVSIPELKNEPIVFFKEGFASSKHYLRLFENEGIAPKIIHHTDQYSTMCKIISNNIAGGFLYKCLVPSIPNASGLMLLPSDTVDFMLLWQRHRRINKDMKHFISLCKNISCR